MDYFRYLQKELPQFILPNNMNKYLLGYFLIKIKRFLLQTLIVFFCQYLTIMSLTFSDLSPAMYPPIGIAFVLFYLFGNTCFWGLLFAGIVAYACKGLPWISSLFYLMADIGGGYLGAVLSQKIFSADITRRRNLYEWVKFIQINALVTCVISSLLRIFPVLFKPTFKMHAHDYINLWLADLTAILVFYSFLSLWIFALLSREKISHKTIKFVHIAMIVAFILFSIIFMKSYALIYVILIAMMISLYGSYWYGNLVGSALLYVISFIYLIYFMLHQEQYRGCYTFVPLILFIFTVSQLLLSTWSSQAGQYES